MNTAFSSRFEFTYQVLSLVLIIVAVHTLYATVVRPGADAVLARQAAAAADPMATPTTERSIFVMVGDYEQEACFILMLWAVSIMAVKAAATLRHGSLLQQDLLPLDEGERILPEDTRRLSRRIQALPPSLRGALLPRVLLAGLRRFSTTGSIQDVAHTTQAYCTAEGERLESELSMIRYIAWAIPSIGFIGTVRGIGDALGQAHMALEGEIFGVTRSLGTAFNSTLIALLLSIVLMFLLHQLQLLQERYVLATGAYCDEKLTGRLHAS
jgi:biopolymer transport protein ExbB/TolQ